MRCTCNIEQGYIVVDKMADETRMELKIGRDWSGGREIMGDETDEWEAVAMGGYGESEGDADDLGPRRAFIKMDGRGRFVFGITQAWEGSRWVIMSLDSE